MRVREQEWEDMSQLEPKGITKFFQGRGGSKEEGGGNQKDNMRNDKKTRQNKGFLFAWMYIHTTFSVSLSVISKPKVEILTFLPTFAGPQVCKAVYS